VHPSGEQNELVLTRLLEYVLSHFCVSVESTRLFLVLRFAKTPDALFGIHANTYRTAMAIEAHNQHPFFPFRRYKSFQRVAITTMDDIGA
jgi:hypothetical protein